VKFTKPVFAEDTVTVTADESDDGWTIEARNQHGDVLMVGVARIVE
jgi:acyl dehydratase